MDRRILKTVFAIKNAYKNLLIKKGKHKITIAEIAREADIDRKTFYLHFNSVEEVLDSILQDNLIEFEELLAKNKLLSNRIDTKLLMHTMNICFMEHMDFYRSVIKQNVGIESISYKMKEIMIQRMLDIYAASDQQTIQTIRIYCNFLFSGIIAVYTDWIQNEDSMTLDELEKITSNVLYNGIKVLIQEPV